MVSHGFFEKAEQLASHLKYKKPDITPLRLQKSLYFLFAFYGASYGQLNNSNEKEGVYEGGEQYPPYLFEDQFEAWQYGPVIRSVYGANKRDSLPAEKWEPETEKERNVEKLIDAVMGEVDKMGDFALVERSHVDKAWKEAYGQGQSTPMDKESIINEYKSSVF